MTASPCAQRMKPVAKKTKRHSVTSTLSGDKDNGHINAHALDPCFNSPGTVTRELLRSELFGHERRAFRGAGERRAGLLAAAAGRTVFLDEVGELAPEAQAMLLRFLATGEVRAVGATRTRQMDMRVIAATHRDLLVETRAGRFREDLYYRLRTTVLDRIARAGRWTAEWLLHGGPQVGHEAFCLANLLNQNFAPPPLKCYRRPLSSRGIGAMLVIVGREYEGLYKSLKPRQE